jgi:hypothetical protein
LRTSRLKTRSGGPEGSDITSPRSLFITPTSFVQVRAQLSGRPPEPFVLNGEDWFELPDEGVMTWSDIRSVLDTEQRRLAELVNKMPTARGAINTKAFDLVLGITCHAVYHAAQSQLLKKLRGK